MIIINNNNKNENPARGWEMGPSTAAQALRSRVRPWARPLLAWSSSAAGAAPRRDTLPLTGSALCFSGEGTGTKLRAGRGVASPLRPTLSAQGGPLALCSGKGLLRCGTATATRERQRLTAASCSPRAAPKYGVRCSGPGSEPQHPGLQSTAGTDPQAPARRSPVHCQMWPK